MEKYSIPCSLSIHKSETIPNSSDDALVNSSRHSSSPLYTNQVKSRKSQSTIIDVPFIPGEIMYKIFLSLPARVLYDVMRNVCRLWRKVIRYPDFINAYRSCSTISPLLILIRHFDFDIYSLKNEKLTWEFNKTIPQSYFTHGDGFILTSNRSDPSSLSLVNPITKRIISLPGLPISFWPLSENCAVSCSQLTLKCKVVILNWPKFYILTVGEDKEWKEIGGPDLCLDFPSQLRTIVHQGFIYWCDWHTLNYIVALDVETKVFHKVVVSKADMLEMCAGSNLVVYGRDCMEFWELDCKNGGKWRMFGIVNFESKKREIIEIIGSVERKFVLDGSNFRPLVILSRDVVIFYHTEPYFLLAYNFKTQKFSR